MTYTYTILKVSSTTFKEIHDKLRQAGYGHALHKDPEFQTVIDMSHIGLVQEPPPPPDGRVPGPEICGESY